jgi:hypothetical protein
VLETLTEKLELRRAAELLAYDQVGAGEVAAEDGAVPEDAVDGQGDFAGDAAGEINLQAVARPFGIAREAVGGAENGAALATHFVQKKCAVQADGIGRRAGWRVDVIRGDQQQIGIQRVGTNRVAAHDVERGTVNIFERHGLLRLAIVAQPVGVLLVGDQQRSGRNPAMQRVEILRRDCRSFFRRVERKRPELPLIAGGVARCR